MVSQTRICDQSGREFFLSEEDLSFYRRIGVPPPRLCPEERYRRRLAWRNERHLYKRTCPLNNSSFISIYAPQSPIQVFSREVWWGDSWDARDFGRDIDFSRPFFSQFKELLHTTPLPALLAKDNQNSDYVNFETDDKNCYMNVGGHFNEDCYYNTYSLWGKNCVDNYWVLRSELLYGSVNCFRCYDSAYLKHCHECTNCYACFDVRGCSHCFACTNLRRKEYHLFNKPCTKEEFNSWVQKLEDRDSCEQALNNASDFFDSLPKRHAFIERSEASSGDYVTNSKNCRDCYFTEESEDCRFVYIGGWIKDSYDINSVGYSELCYEMTNAAFDLYAVKFSASILYSSNCSYCYNVFNSHDLFGCVGMNRAQHCILNKQYSKSEYEALSAKLIDHMKETGEWGEFFPIALSPFAYNESVAAEYMPLPKSEVLSRNCLWRDKYHVPDSTGHARYSCAYCGREYKIVSPELSYYEKNKIPLPLLCPYCRHIERLRSINPHRLWLSTCSSCRAPIETSYPAGHSTQILCEKCFLDNLNSDPPRQ